MNWTRDLLKYNAKKVLKKSFFNSAGVCACYFTVNLIYSILASAATAFLNLKAIIDSTGIELAELINEFNKIFGRTFISYLNPQVFQSWNFALTGSAVLIIAIAIAVFILNPLEIGLYSFFIGSRQSEQAVSCMFGSFSDRCYLRNIGAQILREIYIFLWSLLFVIPGIIKMYAYSMVPFILAENKDISISRAFELSKIMTVGEKGRMFILDVSFIGWILLLFFLSGIIAIPMIYYIMYALLFMPYYLSVKAELYSALKEKAITHGFAGINEFVSFDQE